MDNEVAKFIRKAESDKIVCEQLDAVTAKKQCAVICYHAQQMVEKIIKALLKTAHPNMAIQRTHDIGFLLEQIADVCDVPDEMMGWAEKLTTYESYTRYELAESIDEAESKVALYRANKMYDWAIAHIRRCEEDSKV